MLTLITILGLIAALIEMLLPIAIAAIIILTLRGKRKYRILTGDKSWESYFQFLKSKYWSRKK